MHVGNLLGFIAGSVELSLCIRLSIFYIKLNYVYIYMFS